LDRWIRWSKSSRASRPRPDSHGPLILVEGGRLRLQSDYGAVDVLADATVNDGKLMRLAARMPAASLRAARRR
jgi:hypothetical protein